MPDPNSFVLLASSFPAPASGGLPAYVGLGPGQEFIPYFFTLLGFIGAVLVAVVQWPVSVLLRCLPRARGVPKGGPTERSVAAQHGPKRPGEAGHNGS